MTQEKPGVVEPNSPIGVSTFWVKTCESKSSDAQFMLIEALCQLILGVSEVIPAGPSFLPRSTSNVPV